MPNPLTILARGGVNSGVLAGTVVAEDQNNKNPTTKKGAIIGIVIGVVLLVILGLGACLIDRHRKKKAARGTTIAEVGGTYEEIRPLAAEGYPMAVGGGGHGQGPMVVQPGVSYQPTHCPGAQGGYPLGPQGQVLGQQGADYYRNQ